MSKITWLPFLESSIVGVSAHVAKASPTTHVVSTHAIVKAVSTAKISYKEKIDKNVWNFACAKASELFVLYLQ